MNTRTKTISLLALLSLPLGFWLYCQTVTAQANAPLTPVAVCDVHQAFGEYQKTIDLRDKLRADSDRVKLQVKDANLQLQDMRSDLQASGLLPGSTDYERRLREVVKKTIETKNFVELSQAQLQRRDLQITEVCYQDVYNAVKKVALKKNILLVLSREELALPSQRLEDLMPKIYYRRHVIFADPEIDITSELIEQLNTDYKLRG